MVAKCSQRSGFDNAETFTNKLLNELLVHQVVTKAAFLDGNLGEEGYMKLPCDDQREARLWKRFVAVSVDDIIIIGRDLREIDDLKKKLCGKMKDLEGMNNFVGLWEKRNRRLESFQFPRSSTSGRL